MYGTQRNSLLICDVLPVMYMDMNSINPVKPMILRSLSMFQDKLDFLNLFYLLKKELHVVQHTLL